MLTAESVGDIDGVADLRAVAEMRALDVLLKIVVDGDDEADLGAEDVADALDPIVVVRVERGDRDGVIIVENDAIVVFVSVMRPEMDES